MHFGEVQSKKSSAVGDSDVRSRKREQANPELAVADGIEDAVAWVEKAGRLGLE